MFENIKELHKNAIKLKKDIDKNAIHLHHPQSVISLLIHIEAIIDILTQEVEWQELNDA